MGCFLNQMIVGKGRIAVCKEVDYSSEIPLPQEAQQSTISQSYLSILVLMCVCFRQFKMANISLPL